MRNLAIKICGKQYDQRYNSSEVWLLTACGNNKNLWKTMGKNKTATKSSGITNTGGSKEARTPDLVHVKDAL